MNPETITTKDIVKSVLAILLSAAFAIAVHAIMPAAVDEEQFDSVLVKLFGFSSVAVAYFLILFSQCTLTVRYICNRSQASNLQTGLRFGLAYGLIYLFAMQELMIESSPFSAYGVEFIKYQFFMGLGDAIPVFILCIVIALFTMKKEAKEGQVQMKMAEKVLAMGIIAVSFLLLRMAAYETGIIQSSCDSYAVPCYIWTAVFGMVLAYVYTILYPVLFSEGKWVQVPIRFTLTIGINWIIFNSFMGMIKKGAMPDALLRSGLDLIVLFIASYIIGRFIIKPASAKVSPSIF